MNKEVVAMDDLEFRRSLLADPKLHDPNVIDAMAKDPKKQAFWHELKQLNHKMEQAAKVDVPEGLAHRLLLRQNMQVQQQKHKRNIWQFAMAASVVFVVGLSVIFWQQSQILSLSEYGIAHVLHEGDYALGANEDISLQQVNAKLARFGGELVSNVGQVYYSNFCDFNNIKSLHLVMQGEQGKVSVFIVPHSEAYAVDSLSEGRWKSQAMDLQKASIVVVGEEDQSINVMKEKLAKNIVFSA
jgi:hypothetical protein